MSKHTCIFPQEKLWCKCRVWGCEIRHLLLILSRSRSNICCWSASYWAPTGQGDEACSQKLCSPLACMAWAFPKQHFLVPYNRNPNSLECFLKKYICFGFVGWVHLKETVLCCRHLIELESILIGIHFLCVFWRFYYTPVCIFKCQILL